VSAMDYYASIIAGDLYDPALVPSLLKALGPPEQKPSYLVDDTPGPPAQNGVLDALRKIGAASQAAAPVLEIAVNSKDRNLKSMAIDVYSHVSRDGSEKSGTLTGLEHIGKIVSDSGDAPSRPRPPTRACRAPPGR
jgi:hypothetical protein